MSNFYGIYFNRVIKCIALRISCTNTIYSASILLKEIYVCNLSISNTGHPVYLITYPERDMKLSVLSEYY